MSILDDVFQQAAQAHVPAGFPLFLNSGVLYVETYQDPPAQPFYQSAVGTNLVLQYGTGPGVHYFSGHGMVISNFTSAPTGISVIISKGTRGYGVAIQLQGGQPPFFPVNSGWIVPPLLDVNTNTNVISGTFSEPLPKSTLPAGYTRSGQVVITLSTVLGMMPLPAL